MGLIGWIKKEIESTSRQRRQSAPLPSLYNQNSNSFNNVNQDRDEAYMKALSRFNEYRNRQLNDTNSATANALAIEESFISADVTISDLEIDDSERNRLNEMAREQRKSKQNQSVRKLEHKVYMTQTTERFSLPIINDNNGSLPKRRGKRGGKVQPPNNTIEEIEEFETNHCHKVEDDFTLTSVTSPPSKFYRENSEPFGDEKSKKKITPKKLMGRNMLRRAKGQSKGRAPPPPCVDSESSSGFRNGNYKRYDIVSSSAYEEFVKQSNIYKANYRNENPEKADSVGESASSGSSSSDIDKNTKKSRRMSPPYLTVINKHGEEVEYALPYSERESLVNIPPLPETKAPDLSRLPPSEFDQIINENFNFLKTHFDFTRADERKMDASYDEIPARKKVQTTDLDKSNDTNLTKTPSGGDIIKELDSLSQWTNNLRNCIEKNGDEKFQIEDFLKVDENIRIFRSQDINVKSGILRNSLKLPLEFSFGFVFKTPITLRSTLPDVYNENCIADTAIKKEYEILSQIRHQNIAIMMGISYDDDLRVMSLLMEPFDFTLSYYLHQMDQYFTVEQTVSIIKQIASGVQYLHECGFVHSNINTHAVLIRKLPFSVKLSSFELTTEILPRHPMERIFRQGRMKDGEASLMGGIPEDRSIVEKYYKLSKQHFYNEPTVEELPEIDHEKESRLAYSIDFRRIFSTHFYQAPELLPPMSSSNYKFVLPTVRSDIFSLGLLLWETLNHCIPFVIFNYDELANAYKKREATLPLLDKSCVAFMEVFNRCLHRNADERLSDVHELIEMLSHVNVACDDEKYSHKNIVEEVNYEKLPEKVYFQSDENDPQKRAENAISTENLFNTRIRSFSESIKSSEIEANIVATSEQPEILQDGTVARIRDQLQNQQQQVFSPPKPSRANDTDDAFGDQLNFSKRSDSTMFHSFFDLNRLATPKVDKNGIYERTSTLKKRGKTVRNIKKTVKGLFDGSSYDKMNTELDQIAQPDFLTEIRQEIEIRNQDLANFSRTPSKSDDVSRSSDDIRLAYVSPKTPNMKRSESDNFSRNDDYEFETQSNQLPRTPIARQNKIRRNAWLSESKKPAGGRNSDESFRPNKSSNDVSASKKNYNVSIKIHHNEIDSTPKTSSSSTLSKVNNAETSTAPKNKSDLNKKYYPMMPEMLSDSIRNKREKSFVDTADGAGEQSNKSTTISTEPIRSVKETVKYIEAHFSPKIYQRDTDRSPVTPKHSNEETQTEMFFIPRLRGISDENEKDDEASKCMTKASKSIQKLSEIMANGNKAEQQFPQIRQAQVTVNVQQFTHRGSDIGQLKQFQDQSRHSICNSAELIKRFQMHLKSAGAKSLDNCIKNDEVSASCSSLVSKTNDKLVTNQQTVKCCKYFCRNCGFTMLPAELLQKLQGSGRLSLASSLAQSLQSITKVGEDGTIPIRCCPTITETRSTEDIYIDDDFCQGISQSLAANMELLPAQDLLGSVDFNIFELLQSHPIDWSLPVGEPPKNNQLMEWHENEKHGDGEANTITEIDAVDAETKDKVDEEVVEIEN